MAVFINPQTDSLVIEIKDTLSPQEEYRSIFLSIFHLLKNQNLELANDNMNYYAINLLENLLPDYSQIERMFADPDETFKALEKLKREHFEVTNELRVIKENYSKELKIKEQNRD